MSVPEHIFIPGWATTQSVWNSVLHQLECPFRCLPWWRCLDSKAETNELWRFLETVQKPVHLVGWSLGSLAALSAAVRYRDQVAGMTLISGTARMTADGDYPGGDPRRLRAMRVRLKKDRDGVLTDFSNLAMAPVTDTSFASAFVQAATPLENDLLIDGLGYLLDTDLRNILQDLKVPTQIIHGTGDLVIPFACGQHLTDLLPLASLQEIPGAGHALLHTHSDVVADLIRNHANAPVYS